MGVYDYSAALLIELAAGLVLFTLLAAYAYWNIRKVSKDISAFSRRVATISKSLRSIRSDFSELDSISMKKLSSDEMEHSLHLFSLLSFKAPSHSAVKKRL